MHRRPPSAIGISRALAAFVLAIFAVGWIADRAHVAFEAHDWCVEHSRVEHVGLHGAVDHDHSADRERKPTVAAFEGDADAHAACCVLLGRGGDPIGLAPARASSSIAAVFAAPMRCVREHAHARAPIPPLALAPKQSPPDV